jgi:hypothetical protein
MINGSNSNLTCFDISKHCLSEAVVLNTNPSKSRKFKTIYEISLKFQSSIRNSSWRDLGGRARSIAAYVAKIACWSNVWDLVWYGLRLHFYHLLGLMWSSFLIWRLIIIISLSLCKSYKSFLPWHKASIMFVSLSFSLNSFHFKVLVLVAPFA